MRRLCSVSSRVLVREGIEMFAGGADWAEIVVFCDGCARGNPGRGGAGVWGVHPMTYDELVAESRFLGDEVTNNMAEFQSLRFGLEICESRNYKQAVFLVDSLLVANLISGVWRPRDPRIISEVSASKSLISRSLSRFEIFHIPRKYNTMADQLANKAVDNQPPP